LHSEDAPSNVIVNKNKNNEMQLPTIANFLLGMTKAENAKAASTQEQSE